MSKLVNTVGRVWHGNRALLFTAQYHDTKLNQVFVLSRIDSSYIEAPPMIDLFSPAEGLTLECVTAFTGHTTKHTVSHKIGAYNENVAPMTFKGSRCRELVNLVGLTW